MNTRSAITALAVALGTALALSTPATAQPQLGAAAQTAPDAAEVATARPGTAELRTGFELTNGARWTTEAEEQSYLDALDRGSDRLRMRTLATTPQGRPLRLLTISAVPRLPDAVIAAGSSVFLTCSQHGDEPSGREACLTLARELATSTDPATVRMLLHTTVLIVPTANPDGRAADTRGNAAGVDINRDHLALATVEGRAHAQVLRDLRPDLVHDLHEFGVVPGLYDWHYLYLWPRHLDVSDRVHDLAVELSEAYVSPAVEAGGHTTSVYGIYRDGRQVAGDGQERILRNTAGLRHAAGVLAETAADPLSPAEAADPALLNRRRVTTHLDGVDGTFRFLRAHWVTLAVAQAESAARATLEGRLGTGTVHFGGADNQPPTPDQVEPNPPCAYRLTTQQHAAVARTLDLHGIRTRPAPGGVEVPMAQPSQRVIPLLLDARAQYEVVQAIPIPCH
ncbi:MAG TPA: M14 family zinc carboxypeptidase [Pseudonocardiaceae bacterium]